MPRGAAVTVAAGPELPCGEAQIFTLPCVPINVFLRIVSVLEGGYDPSLARSDAREQQQAADCSAGPRTSLGAFS